MKVLLVSDKPNWAYATIANAIIKHNDRDLVLKHISCKGNIKKVNSLATKHDLVFVLGWQNAKILKLDAQKTLVGIHSHQSFDGRKTLPDRNIMPGKDVIKYLSKFLAVNTVSKRLRDIFSESGLNVFYTPNGVDEENFIPKAKPNGLVVVSAGSVKNDWNKSVSKLIRPVCKEINVPFINVTREKGVKHSKMSDFYNKANCYICASKAEGMSLSILEAASCGCVIISTKCGDIEQLVIDKRNGFLVDRNKESIKSVLKYLKNDSNKTAKIGKIMRETIVKNWSWTKRVPKWLDFIMNSRKT